jgi:integrase
MNYRSPLDGRERRRTIGRFGKRDGEETAESARAVAKGLRSRVNNKEDPVATAAAIRAAPTVAELANRYIEDHLPRKAEQSQRDDKAAIKNAILPFRPFNGGEELRHWKVADVAQPDMAALHRSLTESGHPVKANRVLAVASKMFSLSLVSYHPKNAPAERVPWRDRAQGNPCQGVERNQEEGHERFLSEAETAALVDAIAAQEATPARNCVRLILLTGCRPGEALAATWPEFDIEPGSWVKPSAHTKRRKLHRVPLTAGALALLEKVRAARAKSPRAKGSPYVFPGQKTGEPIKQLRTTWEDLAGYASVSLWADSKDPKVARLVADLERSLKRRPTAGECQGVAASLKVDLPPGLLDARLYDLRHSFASVGAGGGLSLQIIGRLLGHTQARTTQRYAHLADDPLREAVKTIGAVIDGAGKGREPLPLRRGG